jgi:hypothetical protein
MHFTIFPHNNNNNNNLLHLEPQTSAERSEVQGAIYKRSQKIRFPILLPPNNFT